MALRLIDYSPFADAVLAELEAAAAPPLNHGGVKRKTAAVRQPLWVHARSQKVKGDRHVAELQQLLERFPKGDGDGFVERTESQRRFHREMLIAALPHIYGAQDFEQNRDRILAEFGCDEVKFEVLIICPRRWGKTWR